MCLWSVWSSPQRGCTVGDRDLSTLTTFPVEKIQVVFIFLHPLSPPLSKHPKDHCKNTNEHSYPKIRQTMGKISNSEWGHLAVSKPSIHPSIQTHVLRTGLCFLWLRFLQALHSWWQKQKKMQDKYKGLLTVQVSGLRDMRHLYQELEELQKKWWLNEEMCCSTVSITLHNENKALWARQKERASGKKRLEEESKIS